MNKYLSELNPKKFEIGQIVFFTNDIGNDWDWGIVEEIYSDGYAIALYEPVDCRTIDGIPVGEYDFFQGYKKLPKNWNYDMDLVNLGFDNHKSLMEIKINYKDIDSIQNAIDKGVLVKPSSQDRSGYPESEITKEGYRIVWKHDFFSSCSNKRQRPSYEIVNWRHIYSTYEEAKNIVDAYQAELKRQADLSDYDWSLEQIDKTLNRSIFIDTEGKAKIKKWLIDNTNIEDVETRLSGGYVEWKYDKNRRWIRLDPDCL